MASSSANEIFGDASGAQPATPGTYGEPPHGHRLPPDTRLGPVHLRIADLERSLAFYVHTLGLAVLRRDGSHAVLAPQGGDAALVELHEQRGARPAPHRGRLGLYHFAILLPNRSALGRFIGHLREIDARAGSADHLVSESLYLQDPDNLGIEVYADRPRETWRRVGRELMMAADPLDLHGLLHAAGAKPWTGMPPGTVMGHVHLHVGDVAAASAFYSDALGLDRTVWHYPGALFLAAGGYHHHLGTNTWAGPGATAPGEQDAQLLEWTIDVSDTEALEAAADSLRRAGHMTGNATHRADGVSVVTHDPWGTHVRLRSRA